MFKHCFITPATGACLLFAAVTAAEQPTVADPLLSGWVGNVVLNNQEIQAARAAVEVAAGQLRAADQPLFNPELEFEHESSEVDTTSGGISQTIDWSDKRSARSSVAGFELENAQAEFLARRQQLATELLLALADWHTATAIVHIDKRQTELMTRFADLAEQRRKAGDLGQIELDLAHLAAADAGFAQANADEALIRAEQTLAALTGTGVSVRPAFTLPLPDIDPQQLDVEQLLDNLPSVRAASARISAARASVRLKRLEQRPDPTVGFRMGKEDSDTLTGLTVSVPLYVRNSFSAEVDVASAGLVEAERAAASLMQQARANLLAAAEIYRNAHRAWKHWEASGASRLGQRTDLLDRLWRAGELNTTDYLVQMKQALDTEISAMEQRGRMWQAWAGWLAASGLVDRWLDLAGDKQ